MCVFIRSLLDPDAHKLTALAMAIRPLQLAVLHVDAARPSAQLLAASAAVMRPDQANRSAQELLQLEEAQQWVETFEANRGVAFELVVRARLDAFWNGPLPSSAVAAAMNMREYLVSRAKQFGGLNDRIGLSSSAIARRINRRVSLLLDPPNLGARAGTLNSEQLLNLTLYKHRVSSRRMPRLPFCLLVKRKCKCCLLVESCHRNGNKCRPCSAEEERAQRANSSLEVPPQWPADATVRYDAVMPPAYVAVRQSISGRSEHECVQQLGALAAMASMTSIISVRSACRLARPAADCTFDANAGRWLGAGCVSDDPALRVV